MILNFFYPNSETTKEIIITSSMAGALSYLLLVIYQPFGTSQFEHPYKNLLLFPYAIVTALSVFFINLLFRRKKGHWTIGSELAKILLVLLATSVLSCLYNTFFVSKISLDFKNFLSMFLYTSALGAPVSAIYFLGRYIYLNKKNKRATNHNRIDNRHAVIATSAIDVEDRHSGLLIVAEYGNFSLQMKQEDFVYAEAVGNYCFVHFYKNGMIQKEMLRISLAKLFVQLQTDQVKRVHRSFIVNLGKVRKYKGNASGYKIQLHDVDRELVISRTYVDSVVPFLKSFVVRP